MSLKVNNIILSALIMISTSTLLWGQTYSTPSTNFEKRSLYSSKVFSEIDHLMRITQKNLKKYLKTLKKTELSELDKQEQEIDSITNVNQVNFAPPPLKNDVLAQDEKDVITFPWFSQPITEDQPELEQIVPRPLTNLETLHREEVTLVSVNIYTEKNKEEINKYLTAKLEATYFKNFPRFSFYKNETFFTYRYEELEDSYIFSYGPQENREITEVLKERNGKYYARVYFFRLSDKSMLDLNIYDAETHEIVWGKRQSMYVSFKESNLSYRVLLGLSIAENSDFNVSNFIGIRLPVIGIYGIFFTLGAAAVDPDGSPIYFQYAMSDAILITISIGPQISFSLNELFGFSYRCCELFLDFQFGYKNSVAITATPSYLDSQESIQQTFTTILGLSISIRKFMLYLNFDPSNTAFGLGGGFSF